MTPIEQRAAAAEVASHPFGQVVENPNPLTLLGRLKALVDAISAGPSGPSGTAPVTATVAANGSTATFTPAIARPIRVSLRGAFGGARVALERSYDGGTTWGPITAAGSPFGVFTAPADEFVDEAADTSTRYRLTTSGATGTTSITAYLGH